MSTAWASKIALDAVADEVVHRLHVELLGEPALDIVDDGELGRALVRLGEQALRLVEQAGVLERDAHARCQRCRAAARRHPRRRLAFEALERDHAKDAVAGQDRDAQPGSALSKAVLDDAQRDRSSSEPRRAAAGADWMTTDVKPAPSCDRFGLDGSTFVDARTGSAMQARRRDQTAR